jgi:hypothetical protein
VTEPDTRTYYEVLEDLAKVEKHLAEEHRIAAEAYRRAAARHRILITELEEEAS